MLGGTNQGETRFVQLSCDENGNGIFEQFNFSNKAPKKLENATLSRLARTNSSIRAKSYLVNDAKNGPCIVVLNRFDGYSVYNINNDEWIVKGHDILGKYHDFGRSLLIKQSSVGYICCMFSVSISFVVVFCVCV